MNGRAYKRKRHAILISKRTDKEKIAALVELNKQQRKESHERDN